MKFCRIRTEAGTVPAAIDAQGTARSLAGLLDDMDGFKLIVGQIALFIVRQVLGQKQHGI